MTPLGHRIVVIPGQVQQADAIIIPETSSELREGEVLFIGTKTVGIKPGDKVFYDPNSGDKVEYNGQNVLILDEGQIISINPK